MRTPTNGRCVEDHNNTEQQGFRETILPDFSTKTKLYLEVISPKVGTTCCSESFVWAYYTASISSLHALSRLKLSSRGWEVLGVKQLNAIRAACFAFLTIIIRRRCRSLCRWRRCLQTRPSQIRHSAFLRPRLLISKCNHQLLVQLAIILHIVLCVPPSVKISPRVMR